LTAPLSDISAAVRLGLAVLSLLATDIDAQDSAFAVGTATAKRGATAYGEIVVPPNSDAGTSMPVTVVNGAKAGKVVAFVAGSHGTEYASIVALTRLAAKIDPAKLTGTVIILPLLNVASWEQMTVHLNPVDRKGMNGGYPGNPNGTQSERAIDLVARQVVQRADIVVDLHGGDMDEDLRPYSYWTRTGNASQDSVARALVLAFGLNHIIVRDIDVTNPASIRSLSSNTLARGKTAIVAEAGRSGLVLPADVDALINGSLNVLGAMKMIDRAVRPVSSPVYITGGSRVQAEKGGMFFATVARDSRVTAGQVIGYTTDYNGQNRIDVKAPVAGLVTFIRGVPSMWPGATLANVSEVLSSVPAYRKP
jgi:predicted deacylase